MKNRNLIIILVIVSLLSIGVFMYSKSGEGNRKDGAQEDVNERDSGRALQKPIDCEKMLSIGARGKEVRELQTYLNGRIAQARYQDLNPLAPSNNVVMDWLKVDGIFGAKTRDTLITYLGNNQISLSYLPNYRCNE